MIKLQHITKKYVVAQNEHIIALNDISLRLKETGLVVITGTSGCGKTTLL
ncbi:MAG: ATP-binding cassette domain-containing protein, partial [Agathobacter sp.]|nr:ATP-binding cassette domain-containing protein [Agathobacter sp.]